MLQSAQMVLVNLYGTTAPLAGTEVIPGIVLGLDLSVHASPTVSSSLLLPFYLGLVGIAVLGGTEVFRLLVHPVAEIIDFDFMRGLSGVFLSPPYQHVWLTSPEKSLNPLYQDPDSLPDDELALSFEKLLKPLQAGAVVSIILPSWAGQLANRLSRVVPWTGFRLERSEVVYRVPGQPENELVFRKPPDIRPTEPEAGTVEPPKMPEGIGAEKSQDSEPLSIGELAPLDALEETEGPPVAEPIEEPVWAQSPLTQDEAIMIRLAVGIITRHEEPVSYRELLNEIYMELLDRRVNFESAKEIETTLLNHCGRELSLIEELDETGAFVLKKWWLGEGGMRTRSSRRTSLRKITARAKKGLPRLKQALRELETRGQTGYKPRKHTEEDD